MDLCSLQGVEPLKEYEAEGLRETVDGIKNMKIRGAGKIARAASKAISDVATKWEGSSTEDFLKEIRDASRELHSTRPSAVSLRNGILLTLKGVDEEPDTETMRKRIVENSQSFVKSSINALKKISEIGKKRIPRGSTVLTHCNSSAALSVIHAAFLDGRIEEVYSTESRPWRQGQITVKWLAERNIPVTMIVDSAARYFMNKMDIVCVGADTITANGAVINKIGTSQIALAAREARTPFMVCAETYKFSKETLMGSLVEIEDRGPDEVADPLKPEDLPGVKFRNPVFDATPPEYIDSIITELGIISPYMSTEIIREMFIRSYPVILDSEESEKNWLQEVLK
jgi:ribose 1,5-bisphosphate isomerase